jgi:predicted DNA-binding transcriptional regulator YafY
VDLESLTDRVKRFAPRGSHCRVKEEMRVVYQKFDGTVGPYVLRPYHLFAYHGNWYVAAGREGKAEAGTFAVSRIRSVESTGRRFETPAFDPLEHVRKGFGIVRGERPFRVRLLFSRNVSGYVRERVWHSSQRIIERRDGSVELRLETAGWKELVRWILSWQPDCRVLAPKRLRERVRQKMREALGRTCETRSATRCTNSATSSGRSEGKRSRARALQSAARRKAWRKILD